MTTDYKSVLAKAIEAQERKAYCFKVNDILHLPGKAVQAIAVRVPVKSEDDDAIVAAHKYVAECAKRAGDGEAAAKADLELINDAKIREILWRACREVDPASVAATPDDPSQWKAAMWGAFPGPSWMRERLTTDQLAAVFNLLLEVRRKEAPSQEDISDEAVEAVVEMCGKHAGDDIPEAVMAGMSRTKITHLVVLLSTKLLQTRVSVDTLLKQIEASDTHTPDAA